MSRPIVTPIRIKSLSHAARLFIELGVQQDGVGIMAPKAVSCAFRITGIDVRAGNILKQVALSRGAECATPRTIITTAEGTADVILIGTRAQMTGICENLARQPFGLRQVREQVLEFLERAEKSSGVWKLAGRQLDLSRTLVMGVVNVTPDSFSNAGEHLEVSTAVEAALAMEADGADIVDIGGESTRPGAGPVSADEELSRVMPVVEGLAGKLSIPISIDTRRVEVARRSVDAGAAIVNDVTAFADEKMVELAAETRVGCVLMHMLGEPRTMQENPVYEDVMGEIAAFLGARAQVLIEAGVERERIVVDPGIGFGKTLEHNLEIFDRLGELVGLGYPVLVGPSRKRFIGAVLGTEVYERLEGTSASVSYAIVQGAGIVRVHDVKQMVRVARMTDALVRGVAAGSSRG